MNKHIYITGGASGIGLQLAKDYIASGCDVTIFDLQPPEAAVASLTALAVATQQVSGVRLDVTRSNHVVEEFQRAARRRSPDIVVHCAGIAVAQAFCEMSEADFARVISINLLGARHVAAAAAQILMPGSQLVLVASMAGLVGCYGYGAYGASKGGVIAMAEVLRIELKVRGIAVSVVCPPEVETPMVVEERKHRPVETEKLKLLAGTLPVETATRQIRAGIDKRKFMIIPGVRAKWLWLSSRWLPLWITHGISDFVIRLAHKKVV